jgi:hypothetical protein
MTTEKQVAAGRPAAVHETEAATVEPTPKRFTVTMAERGPVLPVGIRTPSGDLARDLVARPWKTKDERALGKLKKPNMSMAGYVATLIGYMFNRIGVHEWQPDSPMPERLVMINQMYMGDVFYAYMWLRREVIGNELHMNVECPSCKKGFRFEGDLGSTMVQCVHDANGLDQSYTLKDPIDVRKKRVTVFRMRPPRWGALLLKDGDSLNEATAKIATIRSSIVGFNDDPNEISLSDDELDELSKKDLEGISSLLNTDYLGPRMVVEGECPRCEAPFKQMIDWSYGGFFTSSSV